LCGETTRVKNQRYCGSRTCQQAKKNKWQREKQQTDPDYQANKRESQKAWQKRKFNILAAVSQQKQGIP
jgi:hypothetical protein